MRSASRPFICLPCVRIRIFGSEDLAMRRVVRIRSGLRGLLRCRTLPHDDVLEEVIVTATLRQQTLSGAGQHHRAR